jgi:serine/threonine-protein kinase
MGEVYRGTDDLLGRAVAVKLLLPSDRDPRRAERFQREARAAARLSDPHVVSVYDFGEHGDGFYLVMELVEGGTVGDELAEHGPLPKDRAIDIVEQAAAGLAAAHREGVVHRDVKPGNLLRAPGGVVKVADFGIASLPSEGGATLTVTGEIIGSAHYLSPERANGGHAEEASDVYALGCVLYQLVTGQPPFTGEHPTAILYQHVDAVPTKPSLTRPELAGHFEDVLLAMLAKAPADRPSAADIAGGALRDGTAFAATVPVAGAAGAAGLVGAAGVAAAAGAGGDGAGGTTPLLGSAPVPGKKPPTDGRTKAMIVAAVAGLAVAAALITGVILNRNDKVLPPETNVGPVSTPTTSSTQPTDQPSDSTTGGPTTTDKPTTSTTPSQTTSQTPTPTPTPTATPTTTPTTTPSQTPTKSDTPTRPTQTPTKTPSNTPSETPPTTSTTPTPTPASKTPPPAQSQQ